MKSIQIKLFCALLLYCTSLSIKAQDKEENPYKLKGLQYGFNFGVYFPSSKTANYYNGDPSHTLSLERAIIDKVDFNGNPIPENSFYKSIKDKEFNGDDFRIQELPLNMKYSVATNIGFQVKENVNDNIGIYLEFNYSKLKAEDRFSIERLNTIPGSIKVPYFYNLLAYESRIDINLGVSKCFGPPDRIKPYVEAALNLNNTKVMSADALIGDTKYSYLNPYNQYYNIRDDGIGYGYLLGGGLQVIVNQTIIMNAGLNFSLKKIHLGDNKKYNLNTILYIRLMFRKLISTSENG